MTAFQHGVASGDPTPRRVIIWTRVSGARGGDAVGVRWRVLEADGERPAGHGQTLARADADWTVRIDVGGLRPNTAYLYAFEVDGELSPRGRTRTLPEGDLAFTRFAQVSCAKFNAGHFNAYGRLAERDDLAFVLHLGDWIYEASETPPASQTPSKDYSIVELDREHLRFEWRTVDDLETRSPGQVRSAVLGRPPRRPEAHPGLRVACATLGPCPLPPLRTRWTGTRPSSASRSIAS